MYAENFYIALYDRERDTLRFLYFVDMVDDRAAAARRRDPDVAHRARPHLVPDPRRQAADGHDRRPVQAGLRAAAACTAPTAATGSACRCCATATCDGAMVVQSYLPATLLHDGRHALLAFVADHILTALERKQAQEELERARRRAHAASWRRPTASCAASRRTRARRAAAGRAVPHRRAGQRRRERASASIGHVHASSASCSTRENFYIALLSDDGTTLSFPVRGGRVRTRRARQPPAGPRA